MRPAIALLLVLGIVLGPVYYAYCILFSGRIARTVEMTERASRWTTAEGSILRFSNGLAYKPIALLLTPDMNSVLFRLDFTFGPGLESQSTGVLKYQVSLSERDQTVLERPIQIEPESAGTQSVDVGPVQIPYASDYLFLLAEVGDVAIVPKVSLKVLEKVQTPVMSIIWTGMGLLIAALIFSLRDVIRAATGRNPRQ